MVEVVGFVVEEVFGLVIGFCDDVKTAALNETGVWTGLVGNMLGIG